MNPTNMPFFQESELLQALIKIMWDASDSILSIYQLGQPNIKNKSDGSIVTAADLAAHRILVNGLSRIMRNMRVVSEEDEKSLKIPQSHSSYWLIDPLDGTKEFIQRNGEFTCNLALIDSHRPVYGFVSVPLSGVLYHGGPDLDARRLERDGTETNIQCARQTGITRIVASRSHLNPETEAFVQAIEKPIEVIQVGSSLKFLRIAEGLADLYPRLAPSCEWDTAAAQAVLEGAGGTVSQLDGSALVYGKTDVINPYFVARGHYSEV